MGAPFYWMIRNPHLERIRLQRLLYRNASWVRMLSISFLAGYLFRGWWIGYTDPTTAVILGAVAFVSAGICDFLEE